MSDQRNNAMNWPFYIGLAIGITLIGYLLLNMDVSGAIQRISLIGVPALLILLPYFGLHLLETVAWRMVIPKGSGPVDLWKLFKIQVVTETVSMTFPAGVAVGEPLRPWLCRRFLGIPLPDGFASITVRKLLLGAAQGIFTIIGAVAGFALLQSAFSTLHGLGFIMVAAGLAVTLAFMTMLLMMTNGGAIGTLHKVLMKVPFKRVRAWLLEREDGFAETDRRLEGVKNDGFSALLPVIAIYIGAWMMLSLESYLILYLLGMKVTFGQVLAIDTAMLILRAIVFFIPSGLGIQEFGYMALFGAMGLPGAPVAAFLLLRRLKEVIWYVTGYGLMFMEGISLNDAQKVSEEEV